MIDSDLEWRTATVSLLSNLDQVETARDVGAPGSPVRHDVEALIASGATAAVEVTRLIDREAFETYAVFEQLGHRQPWSGSSSWTAFTRGTSVRVRSLFDALPELLADLESAGIARLDTNGWVAYPRGIIEDFSNLRHLFEGLQRLGIGDVERRDDDADGRHVRVFAPTTGGFGWSPREVVDLLNQRVEDKAEQLLAADADERWLVTWLDVTLVQARIALLNEAWTHSAPDVTIPTGIHRVLVVVPTWGAVPALIIRQFSAGEGWTTVSVPLLPVMERVHEKIHGPS